MEIEKEAKNFQYYNLSDEKTVRKVFISYANSYHAKAIVEKFQELNNDVEGKIDYQICGTMQENRPIVSSVKILSSKCNDFTVIVAQCDIIICDISQDKNQFEETKVILNFLEEHLEGGIEFDITLLLISTIMTWARTPKSTDETLTDRNYRKRRPHPCFNQHLLIERRTLNLHKKFKNSIKSFVVCSGIVYGEEQDIFHYIFKRCYFNNQQVEIFLPGSNYLPLIYINDFARFIMHIINKSPNENTNYLLAIQPATLTARNVAKIFAEAMGGCEMRVRICEKEEIFLINENEMSQRVFDHLTLDLILESEMLSDFEFEMTGLNIELNTEKIITQFFNARKLKPLRILIDGSPFANQNEISKMLSNFYHLHHVKSKCFLKNLSIRLKKKITEAVDYQAKMGDISWKLDEQVDYPMMMMKTQNNIDTWSEQIIAIENMLTVSGNVTFDEEKEFIRDRLMSHPCSRNQGYIMSGFELDNEMASDLFLEMSSDGDLEFNERIKPDFVIILNRYMDIDPECLEIEKKLNENQGSLDGEKGKQWTLKNYYDSHFEDTSVSNFFSDKNLMPIEIFIDHDLNQLEVVEIFENLKKKIGRPSFYELSDAEKAEVEQIKQKIIDMENAENAVEEKKIADLEREEKEKEIEEWTKATVEIKRKELEDLEQKCLPLRQYLMKYILPNVSSSIIELAKIRPNNPIRFLAHHLMQHEPVIDEDTELDEEIIEEFKKAIYGTKCD